MMETGWTGKWMGELKDRQYGQIDKRRARWKKRIYWQWRDGYIDRGLVVQMDASMDGWMLAGWIKDKINGCMDWKIECMVEWIIRGFYGWMNGWKDTLYRSIVRRKRWIDLFMIDWWMISLYLYRRWSCPWWQLHAVGPVAKQKVHHLQGNITPIKPQWFSPDRNVTSTHTSGSCWPGEVLHRHGRRSRHCAVKSVLHHLWRGHWLRYEEENLRRPECRIKIPI